MISVNWKVFVVEVEQACRLYNIGEPISRPEAGQCLLPWPSPVLDMMVYTHPSHDDPGCFRLY